MIQATSITKKFLIGGAEQTILDNINIFIGKGEFVAIIGRSGAGKSTLLYALSLLDNIDDGEVLIGGKDVSVLSERESSRFRLFNFGFVFQEYALLPELTALENTALPLIMQGAQFSAAYAQAEESLASVGLSDRINNLPSQLSGGQQQRVSIARAIVHKPMIIFADEPTANLDTLRSCEVMDVFRRLNEQGQTIVLVTHEKDFSQVAGRIVELKDGKVISDEAVKTRHTPLCEKFRKGEI